MWRHKDLVTCLALDERTERHLVVGSRDTTLTVWDIDTTGKSQYPVADHPRNVLYGHDDEVTTLAVSTDLDVVVSASKDKTCNIYTLSTGRYVRTVRHP